MNAETLGKAEFWQKVAGFAFAAWAMAIPIGVSMVRGSVEQVLASQAQQSKDFQIYVLSMEKRVTLIEERQAKVLQVLQAHDLKLDMLHSEMLTSRSGNGKARQQ